MLALIAQYLNKIYNRKVLVLVPSVVLELDQTRCYCPNASQAAASLYDANAQPEVFYSSFGDILAGGQLDPETVVLIDEFHDFLKLPAKTMLSGISCPYSLVAAAHQVIALSATFGGE